uniref:Immediate early response 3-interacting protein 1 n=1 Tax=Chromera velia CCMP2878 TaxID=1169474 RepID=A0A0G4HIW7_9ALVE|eukprot:Cvel_27986.t1-p1 / transcript=Cvel_27986.t1 / gene=Cvel_27986 / organism=Chromera_velia_CCMP2878 / gene_product=Immediate early response 3-interacting protein 1, putative / transcript_product=Immediate early response 3-interacting protein 1, putative / location=Cvel_scaffold3582:4344-6627(+) / protein_length=76 / sequence_SO=supercontig / SO=protein_coding / is_pseudo=false
MAFTLTHIIEAALLFINACAVLNSQRFLKKYGMDKLKEGEGARSQIAMFLWAVRSYLRYPLVLINIFAIVLELFLG